MFAAMSEYLEKRVVLAVAQRPFESNGHTFCTLAPVMHEGGMVVSTEDFPRCGLVWWMLRAGTSGFAEPGRLVMAQLEEAVRWDPDDENSMYYQALIPSVEPVRSSHLVEILRVPSLSIKNEVDLVNTRDLVRLSHPPTSKVLIDWKDDIYGPFSAHFEPDEDKNEYSVRLEIEGTGKRVSRISSLDFDTLCGQYVRELKAEVTHEPRSPIEERVSLNQCTYRVLLGDGLARLEHSASETVRLVADEDLIRTASKQLFTRKKKQQLTALLSDLTEMLDEVGNNDSSSRIQGICRSLRGNVDQSTEMARAILDSGAIQPQIDREMISHARRYIEERSTTLSAEIQENVEREQERLSRVRLECNQFEDDFHRTKNHRLAEVEEEVAEVRRKNDEYFRGQHGEIAKKQEELSEQRALVRSNLEAVASRFEASRHEIVNEFLSLLPLLEQMGIASGRNSVAAPPISEGRVDEPTNLVLPSFVSRHVETDSVAEVDFFERFKAHVEESGFRYRLIDLQSFHLSVKCCDITILGGVSGTGKSSLPGLYAEALRGDGEDDGSKRYLHVGVSPAWLEMRDLTGHVNALTRSFQPAETGLFEHTIFAQEESNKKGKDSGLYLVCLDEMNLAHVEHYFSGFLQALSRPSTQRYLRYFDSTAVSESSMFSRWASVRLPQSLRFVGTVNFDETTKQLSSRLLDRANMIVLGQGELASIPLAERSPSHAVAGPPITQKILQSWTQQRPLGRRESKIIDEIRPLLADLGCPLTPRRYRAMCLFVASGGGLCGEAAAFDLQIAQRILPQIRGLYGRVAREALDKFTRIAERSDLHESAMALGDLRAREHDLDESQDF